MRGMRSNSQSHSVYFSLYSTVPLTITVFNGDIEYQELLKTESLDNAIHSRALIGLTIIWYMSYYTMLSKYGNCTRPLKEAGKTSRYFVGVFDKKKYSTRTC